MAEFYDPCAKRRWCLSCYDKVGDHALGISPDAAMVSFHFVLHISILPVKTICPHCISHPYFLFLSPYEFIFFVTYDCINLSHLLI